MIKFERHGQVYYFDNEERLNQATKMDEEHRGKLHLMWMASIVVDRQSNTVVKCRDSIEDIIDKSVLLSV